MRKWLLIILLGLVTSLAGPALAGEEPEAAQASPQTPLEQFFPSSTLALIVAPNFDQAKQDLAANQFVRFVGKAAEEGQEGNSIGQTIHQVVFDYVETFKEETSVSFDSLFPFTGRVAIGLVDIDTRDTTAKNAPPVARASFLMVAEIPGQVEAVRTRFQSLWTEIQRPRHALELEELAIEQSQAKGMVIRGNDREELSFAIMEDRQLLVIGLGPAVVTEAVTRFQLQGESLAVNRNYREGKDQILTEAEADAADAEAYFYVNAQNLMQKLEEGHIRIPLVENWRQYLLVNASLTTLMGSIYDVAPEGTPPPDHFLRFRLLARSSRRQSDLRTMPPSLLQLVPQDSPMAAGIAFDFSSLALRRINAREHEISLPTLRGLIGEMGRIVDDTHTRLLNGQILFYECPPQRSWAARDWVFIMGHVDRNRLEISLRGHFGFDEEGWTPSEFAGAQLYFPTGTTVPGRHFGFGITDQYVVISNSRDRVQDAVQRITTPPGTAEFLRPGQSLPATMQAFGQINHVSEASILAPQNSTNPDLTNLGMTEEEAAMARFLRGALPNIFYTISYQPGIGYLLEGYF